ncbi:hypothetical protein T492DRAFT_910227 [Pavlovales sp. CCMP2436]|nr:hypothetical protein T492DRAFT_910227 [Pavlovales sp. CCMP2436]
MLQQLQQLSQWQQLAAQQLQLAQQQLHASSTQLQLGHQQQLQESASQQQLAFVMVASTQEPQPQARAAQQPAAQPCPPPAAAVAVTRDADPMAVDPVKQEARTELTEQQQLMLNLSSTLQPQPAHKHARWSSSVAPTQVEATIAAIARTPATVLAPPYEAGKCTAGTHIGTTDESGAWNEIDDASVWSWHNDDDDDLAFERPASTW